MFLASPELDISPERANHPRYPGYPDLSDPLYLCLCSFRNALCIQQAKPTTTFLSTNFRIYLFLPLLEDMKVREKDQIWLFTARFSDLFPLYLFYS